MDLATILGLILGFGALIISVLLEGGELGSLIHIAAMILVFGGTIGATMVCFSLKEILSMAAIVKHAFFAKNIDFSAVVSSLVSLTEKARRQSILSLEDEVRQLEHPFLRKGLMLAIDGTDPELIREVLETEVAYIEERHKKGESIFSTMGGFAPTLGIIGTVMGLIHMLENLDDPEGMGPAIASAFIATLYGVASANLIFLPIGNKLKAKSKEEILLYEIMIQGILSIQAGENPRIVEEKLKAFLKPKERGASNLTERE